MKPAVAYPMHSQSGYLRYIAAGGFGLIALFLFVRTMDGTETGALRGGGSENPTLAESGKVRLSSLLAVGLDLTKQAQDVIKKVKADHKENTHVKGLTDEGVVEPVTDADQRSNAVFINGYRHAFGKDLKLLSEETEPPEADYKATVLTLPSPLKVDPLMDMSDILITIDPLDATKEFTEDLNQYVTTMVCVVYKGEPIAGIINQVFEPLDPVWGVVPMEDEAEGIHGRQAKAAEGPGATTVTISRSHTGAGVDVVSKYFPDHQSLKAGGAGFKALLVVDGQADAYVHVTKIKSWDVCAAEAVIKAMGGGFTDVDGNALVYGTADPVFTRGLVATSTKAKQDWYLNGLGGQLD